MKHRSAGQIRYRAVAGVSGLETLAADALRLKFDRHFHETYSFGLVLDGVERCALRGEVHSFEPGTVPMFNPGEVHDGGPATEGGWSYRMVYLDPELLEGEPAFPRAARRDDIARRRTAALFDAIDWGTTLGIEECLSLALEELISENRERSAAAGPSMQRVRERIDAHCCEPLPLKDLCVEAGVSPAALLRAFAKAFGLSPHRYQQAQRMARARRLIAAGVPLAEVAGACGYADQSHLNRWFLRVYGTTPGRYRRNFLQDRRGASGSTSRHG